MMRRIAPILMLLAAGCGKPVPTKPPAEDFPARLVGAPPGLRNVIRVNDWLYTGSEPEGASGFQSLHDLGIRTVITVDGMKPDLDHSGKHGMRYVHIPIGYNAIPPDRVLRIAQAMKELPRPIYLHCHHGKHRGPAAAMAGLRCLDPSWTDQTGRKFLAFAGTDPQYPELYQSVESARLVPAEAFAGMAADFPAAAPVPGTVERMLDLDRIMQRMNARHAQNQPFDAKDAVELKEAFRELIRESADRPEEYLRILKEGESGADQILAPRSPWSVSNGFLTAAGTCHRCHTLFRNRSPGR
jgi:protein tyrosine phosphatase (PTP) superfamily phosphohydrolase (DUF442 family)